MNRIQNCLALGLFLLLSLVSCDDNKSVEIIPNISLEKTEITLTAYAQSVDIGLSSNVDFDVESNTDWLSATKNYDVEKSTITISVVEYDGVDNDREGVVNIIPSASGEKLAIKVIQTARGSVNVVDNVYNVTSNKQTLSISVRHNYDYEVIIPDEAKSWIELVNSNYTKTVVESKLTLSINENEDYAPRKAQLVISMPLYNEMDTISIIQEEGYETLRKIIRANKDCSIFYQALLKTGLEDSIIACFDTNYPKIDNEWTFFGLNNGVNNHYHTTAYETDYEIIPEFRNYKYTVFIVPDSVLEVDYNIHNVDELREFAKTVYDDPFSIDLDDINRNSPLNKLVSYHILPCWLSYNQLNTAQVEIVKNYKMKEIQDIEDFYETLMPHSVMRISSPYSGSEADSRIGIFINRKGTMRNNDLEADGAKILSGFNGEYKNNNNTSINGGYHYISKLLLYNNETRDALQVRMRIIANTLSPDFINSGGQGRLYDGGKRITYKYLPGFCTNVEWINEHSEFYVRYRDFSFPYYNGEDMTIRGYYDLAFKLPPVSCDGSYEIRFFNYALFGSNVQDRGVVQFYMCERTDNTNASPAVTWDWQPCGEPVDLSLDGRDSLIGWVADYDDRYNSMTDREKSMAIEQNDLALRSRGYMKAPDTYGNFSGSLRDDPNCYRIILCTKYLQSNKDYYLRIQKADDDPNTVCSFNFVELVPQRIYAGFDAEDKH